MQSAHYGTREITIIKQSRINRSCHAKILKKMKINHKTHEITQKHTKRGDWARHGPWHDMATTQPTILKMITPEKKRDQST